ncbi:hypothetical protein ACRB68_54330 [Actinomadura sp. RB68]|uniref:DUF397 domain-containing protein n=1 Tax=Actinomadura macrotermitis TaxID=2585200 RepID=A0A7K0C1I9_9ACTN|nr:hypothetical protein [Actinomadura macrotermitis]
MRDGKNPDGPKFALPPVGFQSLVAAIKRGEHDLP